MALFQRGIPRRATLGAFLGFVYSVLLLTRGEGLGLAAVGWFLLAIGLLFARPVSYYGYVTWALLWLVWRGVIAFRGEVPSLLWAVVDVAVPLLSIALVSSSGYLEMAREDPS